MGVFSAKQGPNQNLNRNTFDLSFSNNLTMQFGKIYPVFVKPCDPGDSFNIKASFGLNFLPTVYPVQTPMKAHLHFFYCRNRTVWDDFMNFYTMKDRAGKNVSTASYIPPFLDFSIQELGASTLADYMGIPILENFGYVLKNTRMSPAMQYRLVGSATTAYIPVAKGGILYIDPDTQQETFELNLEDSATDFADVPATHKRFTTAMSPIFSDYPQYNTLAAILDGFDESSTAQVPTAFNLEWQFYFAHTLQQAGGELTLDEFKGVAANVLSLSKEHSLSILIPVCTTTNYSCFIRFDDLDEDFILEGNVPELYIGPASWGLYWKAIGKGTMTVQGEDWKSHMDENIKWLGSPILYMPDVPTASLYDKYLKQTSYAKGTTTSATKGIARSISSDAATGEEKISMFGLFDITYPSAGSTKNIPPYYDKELNPDGLRLSSLPFRHYEAIYNYFYRDNRNNPLRDSAGLPVYNQVLLNTEGGVEKTPFQWRYRNWEQDFLTTAVQEPQLGIAPLVGISSAGVATFANEDGSETEVKLTYAEDGDTITGFESSDKVSAPMAHSLVNLAAQGISISDFRNVNAFQTWLEVQMRKTLRFGDSIQGHFNVNPKFDDYFYPEFIGGVTLDVDSFQVNQTTPSETQPLGAYAGQMSAKGRIPRSISKFCDEPGYIIGLLSVVPRPVYSQVLPKHYLRMETLDYHFPEFNNISYQPITYAEVAPVLAFNESSSLLNRVFGYQRPWYDLISSLDEAHGQFLTTLNGFILRREFSGRPELSSRFLTVHPEDLNDIFSTQMTDSNDVILGQLYFDVAKKAFISKFGIPSLQV